jgi:pimeloyl-ACP methyl ester carboxylesterase
MIPTSIFQIWLLGLFSLGIVAGAAYILHDWQQRSWQWDPALQASVFRPSWGNNEETWMFVAGVVLVLIALLGGPILKAFLRLSRPSARPGEEPWNSPLPRTTRDISRPDGSVLRVEFYGPPTATPLVLSHGWGLASGAWNHVKRDFSGDYQVVVWDEPGLGASTRPTNRDYSLDNLAADLEAVLNLVGDRRAIVIGHSIGGMIALTLCRLFPETMMTRVAGLVLTHTTPTNPVKTTSGAAFFTAIQEPILKPMMYLTIALSPLLRIANWLSYRNGSAHLSAMKSGFAGTETWQEVEYVARLQAAASPAVLAHGMLGMMRYDALGVLPHISVPTLVVAGDKDSTTLPEASLTMEAAIPGAKMATLNPAKHMGFMEHHDAYDSLLKSFIMEVIAKTREPARQGVGV